MNELSIKSIASQIITYIEEHIHDPILLDDLAKEVYLSKYHLHRLFSSMTGQPLMRYIRHRKLSLSVKDLLCTEQKIIEIANNYSFTSEQSFIRSFKKQFGITPSKFRRSHQSIEVIPRMDLFHFEEFHKGILLAPEFKFYPRLDFIGVGKKMDYQIDLIEKELGNQQAVEFYFEHKKNIPHQADPSGYYGISLLHEDAPDCCYYISAAKVKKIDPLPPGMLSITLPSCQYAIFKFITLKNCRKVMHKDIDRIYTFINERWLCHTNYTRLHYGFEYIEPGHKDDTFCEVFIHVPVIETEYKHSQQNFFDQKI